MTTEPAVNPQPSPPAVGPQAAPAWPYLLTLAALVVSGIAFGLVALQARRTVPDNLDRVAWRWVIAHRDGRPLVTRFFEGLTVLGNFWVATPLILAVTLALFVLRRNKVPGVARGEAAFFFGVVEAGRIVNGAVKLAFRRDRPPLAQRLVEESSFSFPSGHAAFSALFFGMLAFLLARGLRGKWARLRIPAVGACLVLSILLGASRIWLAVHYTTDVLGGLVLGYAWLIAAWMIRDHLGRRRHTSPPGG